MPRKIVETDRAPAALGPYSQAVHIAPGRIMFTAGQVPLHPETGRVVGEGIEDQTRQALENLKGVVEAAGATMEDVVKTTIFMKNMDHFVPMNIVYESYFGILPPARSAVEVARLPKDVLIEIEAVVRLAD